MKRIINFIILSLLLAGNLHAERNKLDKFLQEKQRRYKQDETIRVIVQHYTPVGDSDVGNVEKKHHGKASRRLDLIYALAAELPIGELDKLSDEPNVLRVSFDDRVRSNGGTPTVASGAAVAASTYSVNGSGIGVAVIDSGIEDRPDLHPNVVKVVDYVDVGKTNKGDPYGHGTHVAGIIAGSGKSSFGVYAGVATGARLIDLRVLDGNGRGYVSDVIAAIEWAVANRNSKGWDGRALNIRVINMSLGHQPYESADTDPLTLACRKAVGAGLVVVVAAGNYGSDANKNTVFGGITSPGTEPSVITVGAMKTWGTDVRTDDSVASYSSRGPTFIDNFVKPDITAPGSNVVSVLSPNCTLVRNNPQLYVDSSYMTLSGTSMAAAVVSGVATLILDENPGLTPNAVKAILMYTAEKRAEGYLDTGAGYINAVGAVNLAANINTNTATSQYWITNGGVGLSYNDVIAGAPVVWGQTIVWSESIGAGNILLYNQPAWATTIVWSESVPTWATTIVWSEAIVAYAIGGQTIVWETVFDLSSTGTVEDKNWQ